ncbi:hypothetical protein JTB14_013710 [Gonioctena quinquepunctata]|nr:hypothetical protein JTB14_013710 [Gonioctena quinquepunctata]
MPPDDFEANKEGTTAVPGGSSRDKRPADSSPNARCVKCGLLKAEGSTSHLHQLRWTTHSQFQRMLQILEAIVKYNDEAHTPNCPQGATKEERTQECRTSATKTSGTTQMEPIASRDCINRWDVETA